MKTLKKIGIGLLVVIVLLVIVSFFLPSKVVVARSMVIKAPQEVVFNQVNTLKNWPNWMPWIKMDPNMKLTYDGPASGTGAKYSWSSEKHDVGHGSLTITASTPNTEIDNAMAFEGRGNSTSDFKFEAADGGTKVTWSMESDMGMNPIGRYMGLMMDGMLGKTFEEGLGNLEKASQTAAAAMTQPMVQMAPADTTKAAPAPAH